MELVEYPDREMMMLTLADRMAGELNSCLMRHEHASFAVPGGSTPGPMFDSLSDTKLDWSRVHVLLTDERWVPPDHGRSNTRLLRERLLTNRAADAVYVPLWAEADAPDDVIDALSAAIEPELPLSILLLGMGEDGHIASLFPGADRLDDALSSKAPPLMAMRGGGAPEPRITLTAPVLRGAMSTHIVITGAAKRETLDAARRARPEDLPVALVLRDATVHWAE